MQAFRLLANFFVFPFEILQKKQANDNFIWNCHVVEKVEGSSTFVQAQIWFTLDNLSNHFKWYALYDQNFKHPTHLEYLYEDAKIKASHLLDKIFEFMKIYIYQTGDAKDEEHPTLFEE